MKMVKDKLVKNIKKQKNLIPEEMFFLKFVT